jgi:hypothetical protein
MANAVPQILNRHLGKWFHFRLILSGRGQTRVLPL